MQRSTHLVLACVVAALNAAWAGADPLPGKQTLLYEIHETPGDPGTDLTWTITLRNARRAARKPGPMAGHNGRDRRRSRRANLAQR